MKPSVIFRRFIIILHRLKFFFVSVKFFFYACLLFLVKKSKAETQSIHSRSSVFFMTCALSVLYVKRSTADHFEVDSIKLRNQRKIIYYHVIHIFYGV